MTAPANTAPPTISGSAAIGSPLTAGTGSWTGSPTSYSYQWQRCDNTGANCAPISSATSTTYTVASADSGATLRAAVAATNAGGSTNAVSAATSVVPATLSYTSTIANGQTLAGNVAWTINSNVDIASVKFYYDANYPAAGATLLNTATSGPRSFTYNLNTGSYPNGTHSLGYQLFNSAGVMIGNSPTLGVTFQNVTAPANTAPPTISGSAAIGSPLTAGTGSWTGSPTSYSYQWQRCDNTGANCAPISSATSTTYTVASADSGATLRAAVAATNAGGSTNAVSAATSVVPATLSYTSTIANGQTLAGNVAWTINSNVDIASVKFYYDANYPAAGATLLNTATSGPRSFTYNLNTGSYPNGTHSLGYQLFNSAGVMIGNSPTLGVTFQNVTAPADTAPPTISGSAAIGSPLTAGTGSWTGSPTSYSYQWQRCDNTGANCAPISSATSTTYTVASADSGATLRIAMTATNSAGSATATSAQTAVVAAAPPAPPPPPAPPAPPSNALSLDFGSGSWLKSQSPAGTWDAQELSGNTGINIISSPIPGFSKAARFWMAPGNATNLGLHNRALVRMDSLYPSPSVGKDMYIAGSFMLPSAGNSNSSYNGQMLLEAFHNSNGVVNSMVAPIGIFVGTPKETWNGSSWGSAPSSATGIYLRVTGGYVPNQQPGGSHTATNPAFWHANTLIPGLQPTPYNVPIWFVLHVTNHEDAGGSPPGGWNVHSSPSFNGADTQAGTVELWMVAKASRPTAADFGAPLLSWTPAHGTGIPTLVYGDDGSGNVVHDRPYGPFIGSYDSNNTIGYNSEVDYAGLWLAGDFNSAVKALTG